MAAIPQQWPVLGAEERKLLLAALNSNRSSQKVEAQQQSSPKNANTATNNAVDPSVLNPSLLDSSANLDFDNAAFADFGNSGNGFDLGLDDSFNDFSELSPADMDGENGEKRKSPEDDDDDEHGDLKRRDSDDKQAKKPGRKPLTSEPTTKRKAQNRAAQRAFRERKEKHLKDLEQKVLDLEKASESANHENGLLRAQVERLSEELKAYRRRVSLETGPSPPRASLSSQSTFDFDFPRFGSLPEAWFPSSSNNNKSASIGTSPAGTANQGVSPRSANLLLDGGNSASPASTRNGNIPDSIDNMFSNGFFENAGRNNVGQSYTNSNSSASPDAIFDFAPLNNTSATSQSQARSMSHTNTSKSNSPSMSSMSHKDPSSSCCTSPESSTQSPNIQKDKEPQTQAMYRNGFLSEKTAPAETTASEYNFDWLSSQNGGQFDPVLFGDYRESQAAVVGEGDFNSGLFEDALPFPDFNDPFNFNMSTTNTVPAPVQTKPNLMEQVMASREGNDTEDAQKLHERCGKGFDMPGDQRAMMTAHKIWNQLQNCPKFVSGDFDIDSLCTELSAKAKCTETGVAVPKKDVEAALWRLVGPKDGSPPNLNPGLTSDEKK